MECDSPRDQGRRSGIGMRLHTPTLFLMTVAVTVMVGGLFLLSWRQARGERALAFWGVAHLAGGAGSALLCLRTVIPDALSIGVGNAILLGAYGLIWSGVRAFQGRSPALVAALSGGTLWALACLVPAFYASLPARVMLASGLAGLFCGLGAWEVRSGQGERLASRPAAVVLLVAYAGLYWIRIPLAVVLPLPSGTGGLDSPWMAILCLTGTLFTVAIAFVFMALTKERAEHAQRRAAETDPLTGIANRRAFVETARARLADPSRAGTLLLFDLDHFKAINDTYGHAVGDGVLIAFGHAAGAVLPEGALLGRMGGEEFACFVSGEAREAVRLADRVRDVLGRLAVPAYPDLVVRVSVGVVACDGRADLDDLLREADAALYRAKHTGRDRVVAAPATSRPVQAA